MAGPFKLLPVLLLALFAYFASGSLIASIDCGGTGFRADENIIVWGSDDTLISNGLAQVVRSDSVSTVMDTLRVFTTRKKNCYSYSVTKGEKVMVRASFYYGNYDGLSKPPSFDLHFDGNFWTTVDTSVDEVIVHEVTYVAKRDAVSVCVAQTKPGQFPFISALEIRGLDSEVYSDVDDNRALFLRVRLTCGGNNETIRYPNDGYDRIWEPGTCGPKHVTSDGVFIDPTGPNNPPKEILQNAATTDNTTSSIFLGTILPSSNPLYINLYFSEVRNLDSTEKRSFTLYESSTTKRGPLQLPISPPYGGVDVRNITNYNVDTITRFDLVSMSDSTLPPLINAVESFNISGVLTDGTDNNDVDALALLQTTFDVLQGWSGDPCLPSPYTWDWLNCSSDPTPRVTALYLDGFELSGELPDISSMDALEIIDLHNNSLIGTIPSFLGTMRNLQQLNLADNQLSGSIPTTLSKNNKLKLTVTGNPSLCTSGKSCSSPPGTINSTPGSTPTISKKSKKSSTTPLILGTTIPAFILVWVAAGVFVILRKRGKPANMKIPVARGGGVNGHSTGEGEANGGPDGLHNTGDQYGQQTFGSPAPLFGNSGESSDQYGHTGVHDP